MDWKFRNRARQMKCLLEDTEISWPNCLVVGYTKSWSTAWQWKGSPGSLPGQAEEVLLHQLLRRLLAASSLSGQRRSLRAATWRYSAPLKKHMRQIASCYVGCSDTGYAQWCYQNARPSQIDVIGHWKNVRGYPERLKEKHGPSPYGCLYSIFGKASVIILVNYNFTKFVVFK